MMSATVTGITKNTPITTISAAPSESASLLGLLTRCGLLHVQSDNVLEQWLLLVHQLAHSSYTAKISMIDAGVLDTLQKVILLRYDNMSLYLLALCEICIDVLKQKSEL